MICEICQEREADVIINCFHVCEDCCQVKNDDSEKKLLAITNLLQQQIAYDKEAQNGNHAEEYKRVATERIILCNKILGLV